MKKFFIIILMLHFTILGALAKTYDKMSFALSQNPFKGRTVKNVFKSDYREEAEIKKLLSNLHKYSNEHNQEGIKHLYSKDFKSTDGFNYEVFMKMTEETFMSYPDIKYSSDIKNITVMGDWATVQTSDVAIAQVKSQGDMSEDGDGELVGVCESTLYLKKEDGEWKIIGDNVSYEETSLRYGEAKKVKIELEAPLFIKAGKEYTIALNMECPKDSFVLASLNSEKIIYPPDVPKEIFRKMPQDGILERMIKANTDKVNEYAVASIGFTRLSTAEGMSAIKFKMSGMAFIMQRVNVFEENKNYFTKIKEGIKKDEAKEL